MNETQVVNHMIEFIEQKERKLETDKLVNDNQAKNDIVKSILELEDRVKRQMAEFENFRNFRDHGEIKCSTDGRVTIVYGKNGDGKTTLHQLFQ